MKNWTLVVVECWRRQGGLVIQCRNLTHERKGLVTAVVIPGPQSTVLSVPDLHTVLLHWDSMDSIIRLVPVPVAVLIGRTISPLQGALLSPVMKADPDVCGDARDSTVHQVIHKHILLPAVNRGQFGRPVAVRELGTVQVCLRPGAIKGEESVTVPFKLGPEEGTGCRLGGIWQLQGQSLSDLDVGRWYSPHVEAAKKQNQAQLPKEHFPSLRDIVSGPV